MKIYTIWHLFYFVRGTFDNKLSFDKKKESHGVKKTHVFLKKKRTIDFEFKESLIVFFIIAVPCTSPLKVLVSCIRDYFFEGMAHHLMRLQEESQYAMKL